MVFFDGQFTSTQLAESELFITTLVSKVWVQLVSLPQSKLFSALGQVLWFCPLEKEPVSEQ